MPERYLGRTLGKYRVTRLLGTGAFSWVYEAVDLDLEIPVALKVLRPEFAGQEGAESRFRREATTAARLRHPNIVTVRDVGQTDGTVFVAMDLHPLTLGRRLALMGRLPEREVVRLGIGVAAALATAHASGVVHRDIKPDNILIDAQGDAVVGDFGLARALTGATSVSATNQVLGTPQYFSPEQARGLELDGRSDLYALGVTLFRAATGSLPFDGDDWYAVARQHIEAPPPSPRTVAPDLSPEFEAVLLRLLAKDPADRYANAVQVVDALAALPTAPDTSASVTRLSSNTVDAFRPPPAPRPWVPAALLIAVLALFGGWLVTRGVGEPTVQQRVDSAVGDSLASSPAVNAGADSARPQAVEPTPPDTPVTRPSAVPPKPVRPRAVTATLDLSATDSAELYVNNALIGVGRWSGEIRAGERVDVHAVVADAPPSCRTARRDSTLGVLRVGQRVSVDFAVRGCVVMRYNVQPRDSRVRFQSLEGGPTVETRADSASSVLVPVGRYVLLISAPRCVTFNDTVAVQRGAAGDPRPVKLICGQ